MNDFLAWVLVATLTPYYTHHEYTCGIFNSTLPNVSFDLMLSDLLDILEKSKGTLYVHCTFKHISMLYKPA